MSNHVSNHVRTRRLLRVTPFYFLLAASYFLLTTTTTYHLPSTCARLRSQVQKVAGHQRRSVSKVQALFRGRSLRRSPGAPSPAV